MAEAGGSGGLCRHIAGLTSELDSRIEFHRNAFNEYVDIKGVLGRVIDEKEKLLQEQHVVREFVAAKEELTRKNEEQALELEALKKKLQESEARNTQAEQQCGSGLELNQSGRVRTQSMEKRKQLSQGLPDKDADEHELMEERSSGQELVNKPTFRQGASADELEEVREELIKGFIEIDYGGRNFGIKSMGELNEKAFRIACLEKLSPEEAGTKASELCSFWQKQLENPSWNPFKNVTLDGNCQEVLNFDDDKLQSLKNAWGDDAFMAVVNALMEMKEYNRDGDRCVVCELWNYKEDRKATLRQCVEYLGNQVKLLKGVKRRMTRRGR